VQELDEVLRSLLPWGGRARSVRSCVLCCAGGSEAVRLCFIGSSPLVQLPGMSWPRAANACDPTGLCSSQVLAPAGSLVFFSVVRHAYATRDARVARTTLSMSSSGASCCRYAWAHIAWDARVARTTLRMSGSGASCCRRYAWAHVAWDARRCVLFPFDRNWLVRSQALFSSSSRRESSLQRLAAVPLNLPRIVADRMETFVFVELWPHLISPAFTYYPSSFLVPNQPVGSF